MGQAGQEVTVQARVTAGVTQKGAAEEDGVLVTGKPTTQEVQLELVGEALAQMDQLYEDTAPLVKLRPHLQVCKPADVCVTGNEDLKLCFSGGR